MYDREELLNELTERKIYQEEYLRENNYNDRVAREHLERVERNLSKLNNHQENGDKFLVFENNDNRRMGDDHSEVSKTPVFRCCRNCCDALQFWMREKMRDVRSIFYSVGKDDGQKLNEKIVVYPARSFAESYDSDEQRISGGSWLEDDGWF